MLPVLIDFHHVLAGQLDPVRLTTLALDRQWSHPDTLGNNILSPQWPIEIQHRIGIRQNKVTICIGNLNLWRIHLGIRRANTGFWPHGNQEKETAITGKKSQHASVIGNLIHDQMHPLGKKVVILCCYSTVGVLAVHEGATGINDCPGANFKGFTADRIPYGTYPQPIFAPRPGRLQVVDCDTSVIQCPADKIKDKARIVVVQITVGIFEAPGRIGGIDYRLGLFQ